MKFLYQEYISFLKEDGELDTLITDLLISMNIVPMSKPEKGRQHGVDISAIGIDPEDGRKKLFFIIVKKGNLSRGVWDTGQNAIRPSLNEVKDTYRRICLTKQQQKLPHKIIVCTNGELSQNVNIDWINYIDKYGKKNRLEFEFWGLGKISQLIDRNLVTERLFPLELQLLLKKTLAFIDLPMPDYDLSHFYLLVNKIFESNYTQKNKILKTLRLQRLCLSILYKWAQDIDNLKPAIYASERTLLITWHWLNERELLKKDYVLKELYKFHKLKQIIGIQFFNKLSAHYNTPHSLFRYSRNNIEYSLSVWEHIGILSTIGQSEIAESQLNHPKNGGELNIYKVHVNNINSIAKSLINLIEFNPISDYPDYDEHHIEIVLAIIFLHQTGNNNSAKDWLFGLSVGINNAFKIMKFFPLFRTNYDRLVDINLGIEESKADSTILMTILLELSIVLDESRIYDSIKKTIKDNFPEINLQLWFPTKETEIFLCIDDYSKVSGSTKHSIEVFKSMQEFKEEILEEKEMETLSIEKNFKINLIGYYIIGFLAPRHYRSQPLPSIWRSFIIKNTN